MDILISSNLERLLYDLSGKDDAAVRGWMGDLNSKGRYHVGDTVLEKIRSLFWSDYTDNAGTVRTIKETFDRYGYLIDTHTAVGVSVYNKYRDNTGDRTPSIILSTASPYKFSGSVVKVLVGEEVADGKSEFDLLKVLAQVSGTIYRNLNDLDKKPVLHGQVVDRGDMAAAVKGFLVGN